MREFSQVFARVLETDTTYLTTTQLRTIAEQAGLAASFSYTKEFFNAKALSYLGRRCYTYRQLGLIEKLVFVMCRYLSSVTVLLRRTT